MALLPMTSLPSMSLPSARHAGAVKRHFQQQFRHGRRYSSFGLLAAATCQEEKADSYGSKSGEPHGWCTGDIQQSTDFPDKPTASAKSSGH